MKTAEEIRQAIRQKRARTGRVRAQREQLVGTSRTQQHLGNRDFELVAAISAKKGTSK
ncbi:MAG: hypothetical protein IPJ65_22070 [Archangiaceae bacterium]|nr:hypothetical protein [Archangiaceae bacterium]